MAKLILDDILTGYQSLQKVNSNYSLTEAALENTLSRDGTAPNFMQADLDMNSHRILNLPTPTTANEPVRLADIADGAILTAFNLINLYVDTVSALRSYTMSASLVGLLVFVRGYATIGDGGEGFFRVTTSSPGTDDGALYVTSNTSGYYFKRVGFSNQRISAKWYGATGDGSTDDTTALNNWQTAIDTLVTGTGAASGYLPRGTYVISTKLNWKGDIIGEPNASTISAKSTFSGTTYLIDANFGTLGKHISDVTIDLTALGAGGVVTTFGSSSTGNAGGSSDAIYTNLTVLSSSTGVWGIKSHNSGTPESWTFTGAIFLGLKITAPLPIDLEIGDDLLFVCSRFTISTGGTSVPIEIDTTDTKLISTYISVSVAATGSAPLISVSGNSDWDGLFIEGTSGLDWVIQYGSGSLSMPVFRRIETNLTMTSAALNKAFFRCNIPTGAVLNYGLRLEGFSVASGSLPCPILLSVFSGSAAAGLGPLVINVSGYDAFTTFAKTGVSSTANANVVMYVFGNVGNKPIQHGFTLPVASTAFSGNGALVAVPATWP